MFPWEGEEFQEEKIDWVRMLPAQTKHLIALTTIGRGEFSSPFDIAGNREVWTGRRIIEFHKFDTKWEPDERNDP